MDLQSYAHGPGYHIDIYELRSLNQANTMAQHLGMTCALQTGERPTEFRHIGKRRINDGLEGEISRPEFLAILIDLMRDVMRCRLFIEIWFFV